jgi:class 3 adenylate cyclase
MKRISTLLLIGFLVLLPLFCSYAQTKRELKAQMATLEKQYVELAKHDRFQATKLAWRIAKLAQNKQNLNYQKAIRYYKYAINLSKALNNQSLLANSHKEIGVYYKKFKKYGEAFTELKTASKYYKSRRNWEGYSSTLYLIGEIHEASNRKSSAIDTYKLALKYAQQYGIVNVVSRANQRLAELSGNKAEAKRYKRYAKATESSAERYNLAQEQEARIDSLLLLSDSLNDNNTLLKQKEEIAMSKVLQQEESKRAMEQLLEDEKLKTENATLQITILLGGVGTLLLLVVIAILMVRSKQNTNKKLAKQNNEIEKQKSEIEKEKAKSDELLLNILPESTAQELKEKGFATPQRYDMVSVLFTDFKGFTSLSEQLSPEELVQELDTCFLAFDEILEKHNLEKIKTIGDAYMCAGGLPKANVTNPIDAVRAALDIQAFMETFKRERVADNRPFFEARVGVHTGAVVAGVIGKKKFAYDIWGDAVNIASRMESSGEVGKVNISGTTYEIVREHFNTTYRGKIAAKNKGEVDMYFVESISWEAMKKGLFTK